MSTLTGRRGWTAVVGLATVFSGLVVVQLPLASASAAPSSLVRASSSAVDVDGALLSRRPTSLTTVVAAAAAPSALTATAAGATAAPTATAPTATAPTATAPVATAPKGIAAPGVTVRAAAARPARSTAAAPAPLCSGPGWQQRRGQAALASLRDGAGRAGFAVVFAPARPGFLGLTHLDARRIEVFVRSCERQPTELLRHVLAHEVGHAHDTALMSSTQRAAWLAARGIPAGTPWYGCSGCADFATPAGDFAEVYAQWSRSATTNRSQLAGDVPATQLTALAARFFREP